MRHGEQVGGDVPRSKPILLSLPGPVDQTGNLDP
jgi:hypothetical protein